MCAPRPTPQSNRLTHITGLETLTALRELYLSHNGIETIEGVATLVPLPSTWPP